MPYSMITRKPVFHHQQHWCLSPPLPPTLNSHQWISLLTIIHHIIFLMAPVTPSGTWIIHHLMLPAEYAPMDYLVHMLMPPQVEENLFTQYLCPPMLPFESPIIRLCWVWCHIFQCSRTGLGTSESYGTSMHNFLSNTKPWSQADPTAEKCKCEESSGHWSRMLNFPMCASLRFWMTVYSVWPVQDSTLQMGEDDEYKLKTSI